MICNCRSGMRSIKFGIFRKYVQLGSRPDSRTGHPLTLELLNKSNAGT